MCSRPGHCLVNAFSAEKAMKSWSDRPYASMVFGARPRLGAAFD